MIKIPQKWEILSILCNYTNIYYIRFMWALYMQVDALIHQSDSFQTKDFYTWYYGQV